MLILHDVCILPPLKKVIGKAKPIENRCRSKGLERGNNGTRKGSGTKALTDGALAHFYIFGNFGFDEFVFYPTTGFQNLSMG